MRAELIDHMGSDQSVVRAARVSFASDEKTWDENKDRHLIIYLAKHGHWTPFAHTSITFRCSAPVPIRTQCFKHKQGFVENEESRRYIKSKPELYIPLAFRMAPEGSIKQGSSDQKHPNNQFWLYKYMSVCDQAIETYETMIQHGVCPEQARFVLPQGVMVNWYWTASLAAYARFYNQRTDPHAQKEVATLAELIGSKLLELYPHSWKALTE